MTALDRAARIIEENGRQLAKSFLTAARRGDRRAAEALMNRIYGKPEQPVAVSRPKPTALQAFACSLSLHEKLELLQRLRVGDLAALPVPAVLEAAPPTT
jgi:hypothetical protein